MLFLNKFQILINITKSAMNVIWPLLRGKTTNVLKYEFIRTKTRKILFCKKIIYHQFPASTLHWQIYLNQLNLNTHSTMRIYVKMKSPRSKDIIPWTWGYTSSPTDQTKTHIFLNALYHPAEKCCNFSHCCFCCCC